MLEGEDLDRFREVVDEAAGRGSRRGCCAALRGAAEKRLRLDFSALNRLALDDEDPSVRLAGIQATIEDRSLDAHEPAARDAAPRSAPSSSAPRRPRTWRGSPCWPSWTTWTRTPSTRLRDAAQRGRARRPARTRTCAGAALAALGYFSDVPMMEELAARFSTPALRLGAVRGMGRSADPRWTDRLMPVLGSDDPQMRVEAARALGEIEDERAVTPLVELIDDPEQDVRLAVIEALGRIGTEEAREALLYAAEDAQDAIREARAALKRSTRPRWIR